MSNLEFPYEISISTDDECDHISNEIMWFNARQVPFTQEITPIFKRYVIKHKNEMIAGINAIIYHWKILFIDELFVSEVHRHKKLGSYLVEKVEIEAKELGVTLAHTDTFDFQAKGFYLKQGYEIFGVLDNCPQGHNRYYMKKILLL